MIQAVVREVGSNSPSLGYVTRTPFLSMVLSFFRHSFLGVTIEFSPLATENSSPLTITRG